MEMMLSVFAWTLLTILLSLIIPMTVLSMMYGTSRQTSFRLSWYSQGMNQPLFREIIRYAFVVPMIGALFWLKLSIYDHPFLFLGMGTAWFILILWLTETVRLATPREVK